ncbi:PAS domain-containing protein cky-1-like [Paramacrobiotus metropolitanus]|uniref:PAS domain-containing protein cky-1-like n=1 Tax=Paramacrobiotus metropolitanus TaxID=2943436 RepID=UPI0024464DE1|nr:PAS domain-containing protein cky-1-like [Paramacrobiotus metropolitanus]
MFILDDLQDEAEDLLDNRSWDRSTRSQSKQRRDLINREINHLRELLPFPQDVRHRLSQLQLMACICVYLRKTSFFAYSLNAAQRLNAARRLLTYSNQQLPSLDIPLATDFSKALKCSVLLCGQDGKILFISDNAADTMGQNMEDLLSHGDTLYDLIDRADHSSLKQHLDPERSRSTPLQYNPAFPLVNTGFDYNQERTFVCRINSPRNMRRQGRFAEQKTFTTSSKLVIISGNFLPLPHIRQPLDLLAPRPLEGRSLLATVDALLTAENRESFINGIGVGRTFSTLHQLDMKVIGANRLTKEHLGYGYRRLLGMSWYQLLHWDDMHSAHAAHQLVCSMDDIQSHSAMLLVRILSQSGKWIWCHAVLQLLNDRSIQLSAMTNKKQLPVPDTIGFNLENTDQLGKNPEKADDEEKETVVCNRILCTYQMLSEKERRVLQQNPWIYETDAIGKDLHEPIRPVKPEIKSSVLHDIPSNTPKSKKSKDKPKPVKRKSKDLPNKPPPRKRSRPSVPSPIPISPISNQENCDTPPNHPLQWEENGNLSYLNYLFQSSTYTPESQAAHSESSGSADVEPLIKLQFDDFLDNTNFLGATETLVPQLSDSDWNYLENILTGNLNGFHRPRAEDACHHGGRSEWSGSVSECSDHRNEALDLLKLDVKSESDKEILLYEYDQTNCFLHTGSLYHLDAA